MQHGRRPVCCAALDTRNAAESLAFSSGDLQKWYKMVIHSLLWINAGTWPYPLSVLRIGSPIASVASQTPRTQSFRVEASWQAVRLPPLR